MAHRHISMEIFVRFSIKNFMANGLDVRELFHGSPLPPFPGCDSLDFLWGFVKDVTYVPSIRAAL